MMVASSEAGAAPLDFRTLDFKILSATNAAPIGEVHYDVIDAPHGVQIVTSSAQYTDGQRDVERDELDTRSAVATMIGYEHVFFRADGTRMLSMKADFSSGASDCTRYNGSTPDVTREKLAFPKDTYAGAGVMLPMQESLRSGQRAPVVFHYFVCVPGPRVVKIEASATAPTKWPYYPGSVVGADIKPDFGWLNYLILPFLPETQAWFGSTRNFPLVGGRFARYYKGPEIIIARDETPRP
jgi:hypothetical protein